MERLYDDTRNHSYIGEFNPPASFSGQFSPSEDLNGESATSQGDFTGATELCTTVKHSYTINFYCRDYSEIIMYCISTMFFLCSTSPLHLPHALLVSVVHLFRIETTLLP